MSDVKLGTGFRFSKLMAWGPLLVLVLGLIFVVRGELTLGLLLAATAIVFWFIVRRRKSRSAQ